MEGRATAGSLAALQERALPELASRLDELGSGAKKSGLEPRDMDTLFHERLTVVRAATRQQTHTANT